MLQGHLPRVICHRAYSSIRRKGSVETSAAELSCGTVHQSAHAASDHAACLHDVVFVTYCWIQGSGMSCKGSTISSTACTACSSERHKQQRACSS